MSEMMPFLRSRVALIALGLGCELVYIFYFVGQLPLLPNYDHTYQDLGQFHNHSHASAKLYVIAFVILFTLFALAWHQASKLDDRQTLWLVLGFGGLFALTMSFVYPVTALDVFAYVDHGIIMVQYHLNPIFVTPAMLPNDPLMAGADGWAGIGAPYGPLGILIDAIPTVLAHRSLLGNLLLMKLMFSGMTLLAAYLAYRIVNSIRPRLAISAALLIAWNPLVLFETSSNSHNDIVMVFFAVLALYSVSQKDHTSALILASASALVKYSTVLLVPLFLIHGLTHQPDNKARLRYLALAGGGSILLALVLYWPFWHGTETVTTSFNIQNSRHLYSFSSIVSNLLLNHITPDRAALIGRIIFIPVYLYTLWLARKDLPQLLRACFLASFGFLVLANTNFLYWYAVSPVVLAATVPYFAERLTAFLMACAVEILTVTLNIYTWVWLGVTVESFRSIDAISYLAVFAVPALVLLAFLLRSQFDRLGKSVLKSRGAAAEP